MFWKSRHFWDWEYVFHFKKKYLNCYASAFMFDKKLVFEFGKTDLGVWAFNFNLFGLIEVNFEVITPLLGKYKTYNISLGLLGASIFAALEDKRNDEILEKKI